MDRDPLLQQPFRPSFIEEGKGVSPRFVNTPSPLPTPVTPRLIKALGGQRMDPVPIWLMRQAGRYLPEYRALRQEAGDFMACCGNPEIATEITLQPIRRFAFDAAIVFSDILIIPDAMGRNLRFAEGEGPILDPLEGLSDVRKLDPECVVPGNQPLMETLARVRAELDPEIALIGFAGAPFTLAAYMIDGRGGGDFPRTRELMQQDPDLLDRLLEVLSRAVASLLIGEIDAGAQAVQLFDSWAGLLDGSSFDRWSIGPARAIVAEVHAARPGIPFIGFPRGAADRYANYRDETGIDVLQIDQGISHSTMAGLQRGGPVQGNLDPQLLLAGGEAMRAGARAILDAMAGGPHVFNLGHGVIKKTPPEHVADLVATVRSHQRGNAS